MIHSRLARADDDFAAVARLYLSVWRSTYAGQLPAQFLAALTPASWHPERQWQRQLLAFTTDNTLVGTCAFGPARDSHFAGWGEVNSIYLLPAVQRQGVGRQLMTQALTELKRLGFTRVVLWVLVTNHSARAFYQHCGFRETAYVKTQGPIREMAYVWPADVLGEGSRE